MRTARITETSGIDLLLFITPSEPTNGPLPTCTAYGVPNALLLAFQGFSGAWPLRLSVKRNLTYAVSFPKRVSAYTQLRKLAARRPRPTTLRLSREGQPGEEDATERAPEFRHDLSIVAVL